MIENNRMLKRTKNERINNNEISKDFREKASRVFKRI